MVGVTIEIELCLRDGLEWTVGLTLSPGQTAHDSR